MIRDMHIDISLHGMGILRLQADFSKKEILDQIKEVVVGNRVILDWMMDKHLRVLDIKLPNQPGKTLCLKDIYWR